MARSRSSKREPDERGKAQRGARVPPLLSKKRSPGSQQEELLDLQRAAGNRAVGQMLESEGEEAGRELEPGVRSRMESALGEDFARVRVHTDAEAARDSAGLGARAFTVGEHVAFGTGEYRPGTPEGDALIAHELAHVAQQRGAGDESLGRIEGESAAHERDADQAAAGAVSSIWLGAKRSPTSFGHAAPRAKSGLRLQRCDDKKEEKKTTEPDPQLLQDFAKKFSASADLIRKSSQAMKLIVEAEKAGAKFGGYSEDGPGKRAWPYTSGNTVYVPKARTDAVVAASDFLFELNNSVRAPKFAELNKEAAKGAAGGLTAEMYAYRTVEQEVEGMLRLGEIWFDMKKKGEGSKWDKYDQEFYMAEYTEFKNGKKTKDDIVKDVLKRVRGHDPHPEWTVEEYYKNAFKEMSGGK